MKLDNYIIKEGSRSKLIYKKDFEEFLSIPNIRTVIELIDKLKKENLQDSITPLKEGNFFIESIGKSKKTFYFKIGYDDRIWFLKDGEFRFNSSGYDEVIRMEEVKHILQDLDDVSVINYKLGYKNNNNKRIITVSDMITNLNVVSLAKWLENLGLRDSIRTGFDMRQDIEENLQGVDCNELDNNKVLKNIKNIVVKLDEFSDINTENILIDQQSGHLYLLDFMKI